ncbi:hypothetical protein NC981_23545 [Leptolyngbya sp. DQ-M1]|uniref:hypothetical protein n=1 Tax=Leptolyngbya sp. DQ-M1 TaxID=2933920 RepID=UPI00329683B6
MLHHISIDVKNPRRVAEVLAKVMRGQVFPFPVHEGSYIVVAGDEYGTAIELLPAGTSLVPGLEEVEFKTTPIAPRFGSVHAALSVPTSLQEIEAIGVQEEWIVRLCDRGPFKVIEFWVEDQFAFEFLSPEIVSEYLEFMQLGKCEAFLNQEVPAVA